MKIEPLQVVLLTAGMRRANACQDRRRAPEQGFSVATTPVVRRSCTVVRVRGGGEQHGGEPSPPQPSSRAGLASYRRLQRARSRSDALLSPRRSPMTEQPPCDPTAEGEERPVPARRARATASFPEETSASVNSAEASGLPEETRQLLTTLDDQLVEALERGDIRLVRTAWLLALPEGTRLVRRQDVKALEGIEPLLTPQEAAAAIRKGNRGVGSLSHGWLSPVRLATPRCSRTSLRLRRLPYCARCSRCALYFVVLCRATPTRRVRGYARYGAR